MSVRIRRVVASSFIPVPTIRSTTHLLCRLVRRLVQHGGGVVRLERLVS